MCYNGLNGERYARKDGYIRTLDAEKVGVASVHLGAGRIKKEDDIDKTVGIIVNKKISDKVATGDVLAYIHANVEEKGLKAVEEVQNAYEIIKEQVDKPQYIIDII